MILAVAAVWLAWSTAVRVDRVGFVTGLVSTEAPADPESATGYRGGVRNMLVPGQSTESYQWIAQTQQMFERGGLRVRHVDYDNAPNGREVRTPSPYRWWLAIVALLDRLFSGRSAGLAVEHAALRADPILFGLLLIAATVFTARRIGETEAGIVAIAIAAAFPLGGLFLPGQPDDDGMLLVCIVWTVLPLMTLAAPRPGSLPTNEAAKRETALMRRAFSLSGIVGGIGLWVNAPRAGIMIAGIAIGGAAIAWLRRSAKDADAPNHAELPWRRWAACGAVTSVVAFLVEYAPSHLGGLHLEQVHPLYSLSWLGLGEILTILQRRGAPLDRKRWVALIAAGLAVAAAPTIMIATSSSALGGDDPMADRLSGLPGSAVAENFAAWIAQDGFSAAVWAAVLPLCLLGGAGWLIARKTTRVRQRTALVLATGPVLTALVLACVQIRAWGIVDAALVGLVVAVLLAVSKLGQLARWGVAGTAALLWVPGALFLNGDAQAAKSKTATETELRSLIERDLAHWLARQAGAEGAIVLAPPNLTASLCYLGGQRGIVTPNLENRNGFYAAVRIAAATSPDEAQALSQSRNLTHIVIPTWDQTLGDFARIGAKQSDQALISLLNTWRPPRWLRPVPYPIPQVGGFEGSNVFIFQVVEVQDNQTALSRLAEYFLEMGEMHSAAAVAAALESGYPSDLTALTARAHVNLSMRDTRAIGATLTAIDAALTNGADEFLPWERRVSLALALAQARRTDQAREMMVACLAAASVEELRFLTTGTLYRLLVFASATGIEFPDPELRNTALALLPLEMRGRF